MSARLSSCRGRLFYTSSHPHFCQFTWHKITNLFFRRASLCHMDVTALRASWRGKQGGQAKHTALDRVLWLDAFNRPTVQCSVIDLRAVRLRVSAHSTDFSPAVP